MSAMPSFWRAPSQRESSVHFGAYEPRARSPSARICRKERRRDEIRWQAIAGQPEYFMVAAPYIQDRAANLAERPQRLP